MPTGRTVFAQLMDVIPRRAFETCVQRYHGAHRVHSFSCYDQFLCMTFAQLTYRESLRDIETCLRALQPKLYHAGLRGRVSRSTLADANETRDWRLYADFAQTLIRRARRLYRAEPFAVELAQTAYAFDATTIDLCLALFPWAHFRQHKAAVKLHTLLDLRAQIPEIRCILRRLALLSQEALPLGRARHAPPRRLVHHGRVEAEHGAERPARTAADLQPEVGDPFAGARDHRAAAAAMETRRGNTHVPADSADERLEWDPLGGAPLGWLDLPPKLLDEGRAPQDPLIPCVGLPPAAEGGHSGPASETAQQATPLEFRPAALGDPRNDEGSVGPAGAGGRGAELVEDCSRRLPRPGHGPQEGAVATPRIPVEVPEIADDLGAQGVQVEVADEFEEVGLLLHDDGFVPVLEEVPHPVVPAVEGPPQSGVRRDRMQRARVRFPIRTRRWAWFGRRAQA